MKQLIYIPLLLIMLVLGGCSGCQPKPGDANYPTELVYIAGLSNSKYRGTGGCGGGATNMRQQILTETAMTVGAQAGLQWRAEQIDCMLKEQKARLEKVYNFRALLLKDHVLPPVLSEGRQTLNLPSADTVRAADTVYRIIKPPRFVTTAPNWREYLWLSYEKPEEPNATLLPKTKEEAALWNCIVKRGWDKGIDQANQIFIANLERLNRDYMGMILYHRLFAQNMVSAPFVSKSDLGVTGDEHEMRINDRVLRIAETSKLNTNAHTWKAAVWPVHVRRLTAAQLSSLPKSLDELPGPQMFNKDGAKLPEPTSKFSSGYE